MPPNSRILWQAPSISGKPWLVLIHGLGMSHKSWTDPFAESLLEGGLSFDYVLTDCHRSSPLTDFPPMRWLGCSPPLRLSKEPPSSFWDCFRSEGYGLITWTQDSRSRIANTVDELEKALELLPWREKKILVGHSRGGLVARTYLQERRVAWDRVKGVVLLGVPHQGSRIAKLAELFGGNPLSRHSRPKTNEKFGISKGKAGDSALSLIRILAGYTYHKGIEELAPRSLFLHTLHRGEKEERKIRTPYFNFAGTRTDFIRFYHLGFSSGGNARPLFSLFDGFQKILPKSLVPAEFRQGRGDGLVSIDSAHLPWAEANLLFPVHHAQFLVDRDVRKKIKQFINNL
jgi:pimeloyl-ACP methyl ester carboxylesterase